MTRDHRWAFKVWLSAWGFPCFEPRAHVQSLNTYVSNNWCGLKHKHTFISDLPAPWNGPDQNISNVWPLWTFFVSAVFYKQELPQPLWLPFSRATGLYCFQCGKQGNVMWIIWQKWPLVKLLRLGFFFWNKPFGQLVLWHESHRCVRVYSYLPLPEACRKWRGKCFYWVIPGGRRGGDKKRTMNRDTYGDNDVCNS